MNVNAAAVPTPSTSYMTSNAASTVLNSDQNAMTVTEDEREKAEQSAQAAQEAPLSQDALTKMMDDTNAFLESINTDIRFRWHEKAKQMMVEVYDHRNEKVLRTYPPKEFLDTIGKIREYVGAIIDKKV
ncbi:hypothetical protein GTO89_07275 [Heliobacterium gestii]|uniref:Flagellar protein FlaG n=1 Tax=Heliomicrobium gestii TaxID=2699 RepID=A0A845LDY5_HELGE|nr:flagellar protein FlaG [Heliomicrobium gestii]MBM7866376.1 flagellar protein FlaG [Heliomicrobium gestii]MZP42839.1 hypothetical protein [Heliomicrobium gestii]